MSWDKDLKSAIKYDNERTLKNVFPIPNWLLELYNISLVFWNTSFEALGVDVYKEDFQTIHIYKSHN